MTDLSAEKAQPYEEADYYQEQDLADWLHPRLEGRPFCAFTPKPLCPYTRQSAELAKALLCEGGWVEGFMYHRLAERGLVLPPANETPEGGVDG